MKFKRKKRMIFGEQGQKKSSFNIEHYYKVRNKHPNPQKLNIPLQNHLLVNKKILDLRNNQQGIVKSVHKQWDCGWYYSIIISYSRKYFYICWENINCICPEIVENIEVSKIRYKIL